MVEVSSVQKVLFVLRTILQVAEVNISQGEVGVAVSPKTCLEMTMHVKEELQTGHDDHLCGGENLGLDMKVPDL